MDATSVSASTLARSSGELLRPAVKDNHVPSVTPQFNVASRLSFDSVSTWPATPSTQAPPDSLAEDCARTAVPIKRGTTPTNIRRGRNIQSLRRPQQQEPAGRDR